MNDEPITGSAIPRDSVKGKVMLYIEHVTGGRSVFVFFLNGLLLTLFKELPTIFGTYLRPFAYRSILGAVGKGCLIERSVRLEVPGNIALGNRVFLGQNCWISPGGGEGEIRLGDDTFVAHACTVRGEGGRIITGKNVQISRNCYLNGAGGVEIGNDTMLGPNVTIISVNHRYEQPQVPIRLQGTEKAKVCVEGDVWLGANAAVMPGVTIGKGAVIGAGAVVTKDIPPYRVAVGIPAKVVGERTEREKSEA